MIRLLRSWLKRQLEAFLIMALVMAVFDIPIVFADQIQNAKSAASSVGSDFLNKYGSKEGIRTNISNPATSSTTQMTTLDNSISFSGQLTCPSSSQFLEVFVQPSSTGDLSTVIVSQDTNFDGTLDYSYGVPVLVSGVCANGVISCNAGTWEFCKYYRWVADTTGRAVLTDATPKELGGCYCINNSCNLVWQNLDVILKDLGGGVAGAVQAVKPQYSVSQVEIEGTSIKYYGQKSGSCGSTTTGTGTSSPEQYYDNWGLISSDVSTEVINQSADPESYYNLIVNSTAAQQNPSELKTCVIDRLLGTNYYGCTEPSPSYAGGSSQCSAHSTSCGTNCIEVKAGLWTNCGTTSFSFVLSPEDMNSITDVILHGWDFDDDGSFVLSINGHYLVNHPGSGDNWNPCRGTGGCTYNVKPYIQAGTNTVTVSAGANADCHSWCAWLAVKLIYTPMCPVSGYSCYGLPSKCCVPQESINDQCQTLDNDPDCKLKEETVDGVKTYKNFNPTGLVPEPSCKNTCDATVEVCRDWWHKERTYLCTSKAFDFTDAQKRMEKITTTTSDNLTSMSYQDLRKDENGNWITESNKVKLPERPRGEACEMACKTRKLVEDTQASMAGMKEQYQTNSTSYDYFYRLCVNNTCPVEPGEEIIKNCQCINEFAEASAVMQSLRMAGQDVICSDGIPKKLK